MLRDLGADRTVQQVSTPSSRRPLAYRNTAKGEPGASTRNVDALELLRSIGVNDADIHAAVTAFPGWNHLRNATPPELTAAVGHAFAALPLPELVPMAPPLPEGTRAYTRYALDAPAGLRSLPVPPVIVHVRGNLPEAMLAIAGSDHASAQGVEAAMYSVSAVREAGGAVCAVVQGLIGTTALRTAVESGVPALAVLPFGIDVPTQHAYLLNQVLSTGGALLSFRPSREPALPRSVSMATWVAVALSRALLAAECGLVPADGSEPLSAAAWMGRPVIAPVSAHVLREGGYIPSTAEGNYLLAREGADVESVLGQAPRMRERTAAMLPAADYSPVSATELTRDVAQALEGPAATTA